MILCGFPQIEHFILLSAALPFIAFGFYRIGYKKRRPNLESEELELEIKLTRQKVELQKLKNELKQD
jgi:hypothetical protein